MKVEIKPKSGFYDADPKLPWYIPRIEPEVSTIEPKTTKQVKTEVVAETNTQLGIF
jgi:hypothetical protein